MGKSTCFEANLTNFMFIGGYLLPFDSIRYLSQHDLLTEHQSVDNSFTKQSDLEKFPVNDSTSTLVIDFSIENDLIKLESDPL